jgi:VanZ family protein
MKHRQSLLFRIRRYLAAACAVVWTAAFVATHVPSRRLPDLSVKDTTLHVIGYFFLASTLLLTLSAYATRRQARALLVFFIMAGYAALDEITQPLVNRHAALSDWVADVVGAAAAVIVCELLLAIFSRRRPAVPMGTEP